MKPVDDQAENHFTKTDLELLMELKEACYSHLDKNGWNREDFQWNSWKVLEKIEDIVSLSTYVNTYVN